MPYKDPELQRQYQREWMRRRRDEWLARNGPCIRCGSTDDLQVDHVDPIKKVSHRVWSWALARQERELAKCQVLCGDCHRKKTVGAYEHAYGESLSKLTESDVIQILANPTCTTTELGTRFGVDPGTIRAIRRGDTWKHIPR